jgi:hypothetical protein
MILVRPLAGSVYDKYKMIKSCNSAKPLNQVSVKPEWASSYISKRIRVIKSRQSFFKTKPMKAFVHPAFFIIPLKAPIRTDYRFPHSIPYNNVYTIIFNLSSPRSSFVENRIIPIPLASRNSVAESVRVIVLNKELVKNFRDFP